MPSDDPQTSVTRRPPGPRPRWLGVPHAAALQRDPIAFLARLARDHGDVAGFRIGPQRIVLLSDPEHVRDVLVTRQRLFRKGRGLERARMLLGNGLLTSEGEFHLRQRRLAQPAFHRQRIAAYARTMGELAARRAGTWRDGARLDVAREMAALTLAIAGRTLFDADVEHEAREIGEALAVSVDSFRLAVMPGTELLDRLPLPRTRRFHAARARLDATVYRMIAERRAAGGDRGDLLSMLLAARDEEGDGGGMTDEQLRDEAMTIFLAGHETTANALAWTWLLLATNPGAERALHAEVDAALGDRLPDADDVARLPWARAVVAESMRLYPPAWILGRRAMEPFEIGGYQVAARTIVLMSQYLVHRDPRWWPEPDRFDPSRWLGAEGASPARPRMAYFPFGGGTRVCIGEQFAWMEATLVLATLARRWRVRVDAPERVGMNPSVTLRPVGLTGWVERR